MTDKLERVGTEDFPMLQERADAFKKKTGRRPRILLTSITETLETRAVKVVALVYADAGFDVDISPRGISPDLIAGMAIENDVHVVGVVGPDMAGKRLISEISKALEKKEADDIKVVLDTDQLIEKKMTQSPDFELLATRSANQTLNLIGA